MCSRTLSGRNRWTAMREVSRDRDPSCGNVQIE
jgi:hypothetical protein